MSMFDEDRNDKSALEDKVLETLMDFILDHGKGELASRLAPPEAEKGMAVEVQAPDKDHLKEGLEKAGDVLEHAPEVGAPADEDKSDEDKLAELLASDSEDDDEDEEEENKK